MLSERYKSYEARWYNTKDLSGELYILEFDVLLVLQVICKMFVVNCSFIESLVNIFKKSAQTWI